MTQRSTRNKIRYQAEQAIKKTESIQQHLKNLDDLAAGRSEVVKRSMPGIVGMSEMLLTTLRSFRESL